jgi:hypothetical protein
MLKAIGQLLLLPFRLAALIIEILGRGLAIVAGLAAFGIGALLFLVPPFTLVGAPLCLLSAIVVVKAA